LDPEEFTMPLPRSQHRLLPDGIHTGTGGESWNGVWKTFFTETPDAGAPEILVQLAQMMKDFGIG
jgi:hypothetical protein